MLMSSIADEPCTLPGDAYRHTMTARSACIPTELARTLRIVARQSVWRGWWTLRCGADDLARPAPHDLIGQIREMPRFDEPE